MTTPSWYNTNTSSADVFYTGDYVTLNDRPGGAAATVTINGSVNPGSITVSNTAVKYTITGGGSINGSSALVMNGPSALTINTFNAYSGGTQLNGGLLNLGSAEAIGSGPLTISGGSLDNTSGTVMTLGYNNPQSWNGSFTFVGSNPLNLGSGTVALGATPTVNVSAGTLTVGGIISGRFGLTVTGTGTLNLGAANNYAGNTTINQGVLQMGALNAIPSGAETGNLVFSNAATSAVLDLNGNNATVNGLSQPSLSTTNMVVNNQSGTSVLSVGNNNVSSTFGGVLADNNTGTGGQLALTKIGTGTLTLLGSNTYSGQTTVSGGALQLGSGNSGQDGSINFTNGIVNNATLALNFFSPESVAGSISGTGVLALNGPGGVTFTGLNNSAGLLAIANTGAISGGTLSLNSTSGVGVNTLYLALTNTATGTTTLNMPISMQNGREDWAGNSAGTLDIESAIAQSSGHFFIDDGNYTMGAAGSISLPIGSYALVMNDIANTTTNFVQSGGLISIFRPSNNALYLTQAGTANYTISGGSLVLAGGIAVIGDGASGPTGNLTINGAGALVSSASTNLAGTAGGIGQISLQNGLLQTDALYTTGTSSSSIFNFSGGTLQPIDGSIVAWGSATTANNISITLSGTHAVMISTDASGSPQTVPVYANLVGNGGVHFAGTGILLLASAGNTYSGGSFVDSGTVQLGNATALGTGSVMVNSGTVDLAGLSPSIASLAGRAGGLVENLTGGTNSILTITQSTSTVFGGTISDGPTNNVALVLQSSNGAGVLVLAGSDNYSGGTYVESGTLVDAAEGAIPDGSSLTVAAGGTMIFDSTSAGSPVEPTFVGSARAIAVPEPGTLALVIAALWSAVACYRFSRRPTKPA